MLKLARFLKPYTGSLLLVVGLIFTQVMADLYLPNLMSQIVNVGIANGDIDFIMHTGLTMLGIALLGMCCSISSSFFSSRNALGAARDLRNAVFTKIESFSQTEFDKFGSASLITRTTNDVQQMQMMVMMAQRMVVRAPLAFVGALLNAINKDVSLMQILLFSLPLIILVIYTTFSRATPLFSLGQKKLDRLNQVLREGLSGVRVIRAFHRDEYQSERFNTANYDLTGNAIKVQRTMARMMPLMMLIMNFTTIAIIWFGAENIDRGFLAIGDLMAFSQYIMTMLFSILNMSFMFLMFPRAAVSGERINEVLEQELSIKESLNTIPLSEESKKRKGLSLVFDKVHFRYPGGENTALTDVSFRADPGETVAIIGSTGSGKTTIAQLIQRFYDIESGSISIDGIEIKDLALEELRQQIGYVPQRSILFSGSVAANLLYGKDDATAIDRAHALNIAQAWDFVDALPEKEDDFVAQGGGNFSGGQKQRLSIARALIRDPRLLVFDDSFSALDFKTDAKLREALAEHNAETTRLIIAQRVSTIMYADRIIVLEEGRLVGMGTHEELMQSCQVYLEIVKSQLADEEIA